MKNMNKIKESLIYKSSTNIFSENNYPIWYELMEKNNIDDLILLINNSLDVTKRNNNNDSWLLYCIKTKMPNYILIMGLNRENKNWFSKNKNGESPFFNLNLTVDYAEIIGKKYWIEGYSWKLLLNNDGLSPVDFFKKNDILNVAKRLEYWNKISFRR